MNQVNKNFVEGILSKVQDLEEMGGPETLKDYVEILETVKRNIEDRLTEARLRISQGEE